MELLAIVRTMWRHRVLSLTVVGLTFLGLIYVAFLTPREYETTSSTVLFPARERPSAEEIQEDPSLGAVGNNPFSLFGDPSVIIDVVAKRLSTESAREALSAAGADDRYEISASVSYGSTRPFVEVVAIGDDPEAASRTIEVVQTAVAAELQKVQEEQGVDPRFMITPFVVDPGDEPVLLVSGLLRPAVAVLGLGGIALFVMLSVAVALDHRRAERTVGAGPGVAAEPTPVDGVRPRRADADAEATPTPANAEVVPVDGSRVSGADADAEATPVDGARPRRADADAEATPTPADVQVVPVDGSRVREPNADVQVVPTPESSVARPAATESDESSLEQELDPVGSNAYSRPLRHF
jgi:hypothetical protein